MTKYQPRRKNIRLQGFDYRTAAYYFLTICTHQREWLFEAGDLKEIVEITLINLPNWPTFGHVEIGEFVIMPNHIHLILIFIDPSFTTDDFKNESKRLSKSVGSAVATFKGEVIRRIRAKRRDVDLKVWQRGYYDRIIRNEDELNQTREYIRLNPERWEQDAEFDANYLDRLLKRMNYRPG